MVIEGNITFPGDKSISHRSLMFAALANGESWISNLSTGADVQSTRKCLEACGIQIWDEGNDVIVQVDQEEFLFPVEGIEKANIVPQFD